MKSDVENLSPTRAKLTIEVPFADLAPAIDSAYKRIAASVNVPGFRRGKVPSRIIDQRIGRSAVLEEAINEVLPGAYDEAVRIAGIVPAGRPAIDLPSIEDGKDLTFTAEVDIRPDFDLPNLDELEVVVDDVVADEAEVEERLTDLRTRFATLNEIETPAEDGNILTVDLSGAHEGEDVEDLKATAISYEVGKDGLVPGFDEAVRGAVAGDEREFSFVPTAGPYIDKSVDVKVSVKAVRERVLPAADDDFAQMASEFDTIEELREDLRRKVTDVREIQQGMQVRDKVQEKLLELIDFPVPQGVIDTELEEHFQDGHGDDEHRASFEQEARERLRAAFIFDKIAEQDEIKVEEEELSAWLVQSSQRYGMSPDEFANALVEAGQVQSAVAEVRRSKALASAMERAKVVDSSGNTVDIRALDEKIQAFQMMQQIQQMQQQMQQSR